MPFSHSFVKISEINIILTDFFMFVLYFLTITIQFNHVAFILRLILFINTFLLIIDNYSKCLFELQNQYLYLLSDIFVEF